MDEGKKEAKGKKNKQGNEGEKKNTDNWKQIQEQKKKMKLEQANNNQDKGGQKKNKKKEKKQQKQQKPEPKKEEEPVPVPAQKEVKVIKTVQSYIIAKFPELKQNRKQQLGLLKKAKNSLVSSGESIIYISDLRNEMDCSIVEIPGYSRTQNAEIVCRYQDISVLLQNTIHKIFLDAYVIFGNGNILAKKGTLNIVMLAKYFNKEVIACCGSWNYCGDCPISDLQVEDTYGERTLDQYDLIEGRSIDSIVLQSGSIIPAQVAYHICEGYKKCGLENINW